MRQIHKERVNRTIEPRVVAHEPERQETEIQRATNHIVKGSGTGTRENLGKGTIISLILCVVYVYHIGNGLVSPGRNRQVNNPPPSPTPPSHGVILGSEAPPPSNQWVGGGAKNETLPVTTCRLDLTFTFVMRSRVNVYSIVYCACCADCTKSIFSLPLTRYFSRIYDTRKAKSSGQRDTARSLFSKAVCNQSRSWNIVAPLPPLPRPAS
jgi:hypothetical protein